MPILHKSKECNVFKNIYETIRPISILITLMIFTKSETSDLYNKDILLFIEDITAFTGIDKGVIESLIIEHREENGLCRLFSMIGVTTGYYQKRYVGARRVIN